ncbi:MAG: hypothetical protein JWN80_153 [Microbacteriaceae bacterium]|nr:hypothetical protein [Microbacteriaceae bacterium]
MTAVTPTVAPSPATRTLSVASLVLGLVSIVFGFTFVVPLLAIILGGVGAKREPHARAFAIWGIVLGSLCIIGWVIVVFVVVIIAAATAGGDLLSGLAQWL